MAALWVAASNVASVCQSMKFYEVGAKKISDNKSWWLKCLRKSLPACKCDINSFQPVIFLFSVNSTNLTNSLDGGNLASKIDFQVFDEINATQFKHFRFMSHG